MDMLLFRNDVIDKMTKQTEQNYAEKILPVPFKRVPRKRHQLGKHNGQVWKVRKVARTSTKRLKNVKGLRSPENGPNVSPQSVTIEDKPSMYLDCFNKLY